MLKQIQKPTVVDEIETGDHAKK